MTIIFPGNGRIGCESEVIITGVIAIGKFVLFIDRVLRSPFSIIEIWLGYFSNH